MVSRTVKEQATEEIEMQMTPMIDVTFLLLIFFLCSIKFKLLDGKMQTYLPRDVGVNATPLDVELEKIDINLYVDKNHTFGFYIKVNNKRMRNMTQFYLEVKDLHQRAPELKSTIYPQEGIMYGQVVRTVNECLRAELTQITFGGTPMGE